MRSQGLGTDHLSAKDVVQRSPCSAGTISAEIWMNSVDYERRSNFWYQLYRFEICSPFFPSEFLFKVRLSIRHIRVKLS